MDPIRNAAFMSVGRVSGFAGFAVACLMFGLSFDPLFATRAGAVSTLAITLILYGAAQLAPNKPYKQTHLWLLLAAEDRPPDGAAQRLVGTALREAYLWFARQGAFITGFLLVMSVILQVVRVWFK